MYQLLWLMINCRNYSLFRLVDHMLYTQAVICPNSLAQGVTLYFSHASQKYLKHTGNKQGNIVSNSHYTFKSKKSCFDVTFLCKANQQTSFPCRVCHHCKGKPRNIVSRLLVEGEPLFLR